MGLNLREVERGLRAFYKTGAKSKARIRDVQRIGDGWENEVYAFALANETSEEPAREDLILRIYPGDDALRKAPREFHAMRRLHDLGFPVPRMQLLEVEGSLLGRPFVVMERIPGRSIGEVFGDSSDEGKQELLGLFCRLLVDLHTLDWRSLAPDDPVLAAGNTQAVIRRELSEAAEYVRAFGLPEFAPVIAWLNERCATVRWGPLSILHGDYHGENILLRDDGAAFVIDWCNVHVSDRRHDLGWTLLLSSTYGRPEMRPRILHEYELIAGCRMEDMDYFDVASSARRLFDITASLAGGAERLGMRPGTEARMRGNASHIRSVYAVLLDRTGITLPSVEALLAALG